MEFINMCSKIESEIKSIKNHINYLECQRIAFMLKGFVEDEVRLRSCIDEIQAFHRDMFVLPTTEGKQATPLKKDDTESEHHVTQPGCSRNVPSDSMDKSTPSQPRLTLKIPKYLLNKTYSTENDSDVESFDLEEELNNYIVELPVIKNELNDVEDASHGIRYEADYVKDSSDISKSESGSSKNDSNNSKSGSDWSKCESNSSKSGSDWSKCESNSSKSESDWSKSESNSSKSELSDEENELGKTLLLGLLADSERHITGELLRLISKFSSFQNNLRKVEVTVAQVGEIFPSASNGEIKKLFRNLSGSVLYLDKTISNIYAIYLQMLDNLKR